MRLAFLLSKRSRKESWSLRGWVIVVAAISIGGALLTGALAGWYSWHEQKARLDQSMVATTRAIIKSTDIELDQAVALARGLAIAPSLESGDISAYEKRSRALVEPFGYFFVLTDLGSSKELFNTAVPPGTGYPALPSEWMRSLENTQTPIVRPIFQGPADGMWTTFVQMTTSFAQGKNYVITLGVPYERFQRIIDEELLPPEWSPVVIDQDWKIVARQPNPEFIGAEAANPHWIKQPSPDITYEGRELEGYETVNARSRSEKFGWTAAVAVPQSLLLQQFLGPAALAALTGFVVCLVALGTIGLLASRLVRDVRVLSKAAEQLSERQVVQAGAMHITELKGVANEIQHASERLNAEEQFRKRAEFVLRESEQKALVLVTELEKADQNKNQFISVLSHELRNPLAAISAGVQILDVTQDINQIVKAKEIMKRQTNQLCKLVDDLLELTRISQNKIKLKKECINLNEIIKGAVEDIKPEYEKKGVELGTKIQTRPIFLDADPVRITQALGNILFNALKFTNAKGTVWVTLKEEKNDAIISVKDNGSGISSEILPRLFTPFTQAENTLARNSGGLGLGLSIVKGIVDLHGGTITAFSDGLGKGSTFMIHLPITMGDKVTTEHQELNNDWRNNLKLLVIEDNKDFAELLSAMLSTNGYEVSIAYDGTEGIKLAKQTKPDVIFCDIGLPDMNGFDVAEVIKNDDELKDIHLIALSGYASAGDVEHSLKAGFMSHLAKPVDFKTLRSVLEEAGDRME